MKKLFAILLTLAMVLSLAACGGDSGKKDDSAPADGESQQDAESQTGEIAPLAPVCHVDSPSPWRVPVMRKPISSLEKEVNSPVIRPS